MTAPGRIDGRRPGDDDDRPRLAPHVRLHFDRHREQWVLQAPERVVVLDDVAAEVLRRCDGILRQDEIVDGLAAEFDAPREEIDGDVADLIEHLRARGLML
jgi:pyrroloquinoline quinone biosynthesis protein D